MYMRPLAGSNAVPPAETGMKFASGSSTVGCMSISWKVTALMTFTLDAMRSVMIATGVVPNVANSTSPGQRKWPLSVSSLPISPT